jgi:hypothetical protein
MTIITKYPGLVSTVNSWADPDNIKADDGVYATTHGALNTNYDIIGSNFGFAIPTGSTINSITCEVQYKMASNASGYTGTLQMQYDGTLLGTSESRTTENTSDYIWVKSSNNGSPTVQQINNDLFQCLFRIYRRYSTDMVYSVDFMRVTIDYTEPTTETHNGEFAISQASAVGVAVSKQTNAILSINQGSSASVNVQKTTHATLGVLQESHVTASVKKSVNLALQIAQTSAVSATAKKLINGILSITQGSQVSSIVTKIINSGLSINQVSEVSVLNKKSANAALAINQTSVVEVTVSRQEETENKNAVLSILQPSVVTVSAKKSANAVMTISEESMVASSVRKQTWTACSIVQISAVSAIVTKSVNAILSIACNSAVAVAVIMFTDEVIAGVRRGVFALSSIAHGRAAMANRHSGSAPAMSKDTGIYRVNNKLKGTVDIND